MAGGRSDFAYTDDLGVTYALNQDTSNGAAAGNLASSNGVQFLPRNTKPRFGMYADQNGLRHRKLYAGSAAIYAALPATFTGGDEIGPILFTLLYVRGEKSRRSRSVNTGIIP